MCEYGPCFVTRNCDVRFKEKMCIKENILNTCHSDGPRRSSHRKYVCVCKFASVFVIRLYILLYYAYIIIYGRVTETRPEPYYIRGNN